MELNEEQVDTIQEEAQAFYDHMENFFRARKSSFRPISIAIALDQFDSNMRRQMDDWDECRVEVALKAREWEKENGFGSVERS